MLRYFAIFFISAVLSVEAQANIYYIVALYSPTHQFQSMQQACDTYTKQVWPSRTATFTVTATTTFRCNTYDTPGGPSRSSFSGQIFGQNCTSPKAFDSSVGGCVDPEPDPCESKAGQSLTHEHLANKVGASTAPSEPPGAICENACQYAYSQEQPKRCYRFSDGASDNIFCEFRYQANGISCTASATPNPGSVFDQPPTKPPMAVDPELLTETKCDQWVTNADGTVSRSCTGTDTFVQPGKMSCSDTAAAAGCTAGSPAPVFTETKVTEDTTKTTNPDGSSKTETTKTTDKTTCKGAKPCSSESKTETSESGTNPDGSPGDDKSTCTGSACKSDDADKEGEEGEEEGEETERTATAGACDVALSCSGDAIDCAVLEQQKEQRCFAEEQADFDGHKSEIEGLLQGEKFTLDEGDDVEIPSFINQGTRFLNPSCPADRSISLSFKSVAVSFEPLCDLASALGPLIVAFTAVFCALYIGRSVGGN